MRASSGLINQLSSNERDVCARGGRREGGGGIKESFDAAAFVFAPVPAKRT